MTFLCPICMTALIDVLRGYCSPCARVTVAVPRPALHLVHSAADKPPRQQIKYRVFIAYNAKWAAQ